MQLELCEFGKQASTGLRTLAIDLVANRDDEPVATQIGGERRGLSERLNSALCSLDHRRQSVDLALNVVQHTIAVEHLCLQNFQAHLRHDQTPYAGVARCHRLDFGVTHHATVEILDGALAARALAKLRRKACFAFHGLPLVGVE